jgi:hypothetical protein
LRCGVLNANHKENDRFPCDAKNPRYTYKNPQENPSENQSKFSPSSASFLVQAGHHAFLE